MFASMTDSIRYGAVFPQTEIGGDRGAVRAYVQAVEELGYSHLIAYDHVVGADRAVYPDWQGPYDLDSTFREPLVLFAYVVAITSLEVLSGILILPQRQTVLVAKQAAEIDLLSDGRIRLGVGLGWNEVEYEALGQDFSNRGARISEQVELLRRLWSEPSVTFDGRYERVTGAGIAPLPVQRPIPIWFGAFNERAIARAGRIADGWLPGVAPGPKLAQGLEILRTAAAGAGRDPASIGLEGRISFARGDDARVIAERDGWLAERASHIGVNTMGAGLKTVDEHIAALGEAMQMLRG
jgi:probable F420-dependent oxidoreductase